MGRNLKIVIAAILTLVTLAIASCSSTREQSSHPTPTDKPAPRQPFHNPVVSVNKKVTNQPFHNPVVVTKQTPPVVPITTANLIQPTDSTKRVSIVSKGRNDPFAKIVVPYSIKVTNQPAQVKPVPKSPPLSAATPFPPEDYRLGSTGAGEPGSRGAEMTSVILHREGSKRKQHSASALLSKNPLKQKLNQQKHRINKKAIRLAIASLHAQSAAPKRVIKHNSLPPVARASHNKIKPNRALTRVVPKVLPQAIPNPALASITPPQPELAKAVFVSGVILIGKKSQAIIKVPNEPTSQYVHAGQQLANGVLIKRIEINEGSEPVVILEQYGIEVAKMVGQRLTT
ncbi:hypothetical protein [Brasilonema bromeliae]|uniref:hypothetical protein n=1 Tax=Brasilonema bromeliae TaxID=383615 RepID=UPI001FE7F004|nr:hypothetical protein [Brasilonema bromeliae]